MKFNSLGISLRGHLAKGIASGFPPCCIAYFLLRMVAMDNSTKIYKICHKNVIEKGKKYKNRIQHVMCPYHDFIHSLDDYKTIPYYTCRKCNWQQYKDKICNMCGEPCEERIK